MRRVHSCAAVLLLAASQAFALPKTTGWTEVRTPNFTIHSHASLRQTKKIATDLERFREVLNLITRGVYCGPLWRRTPTTSPRSPRWARAI